jgi:hypothetical protein
VRTWHGDGEEEVERGLEEGLSVICRHGKDLDGFLALVEGGHTHSILGFVLDSHGFQDGGGHIPNMVGDSTHTPIGFQCLTYHIGESKMMWPWSRRYRRWWVYSPYYPYAYPPMYPQYPPPIPQSLEDELEALEDYKKELEEEKASIEREISDVEARIKELKMMLEKGRKP